MARGQDGTSEAVERYLLFDSSCARCGNLARTVETIADGWLASRPLDDPEIEAELDRVKPGWAWKPMLLTRHAGRVRVYAGLPMVLRLGAGLGPVRTFRLLTSAA